MGAYGEGGALELPADEREETGFAPLVVCDAPAAGPPGPEGGATGWDVRIAVGEVEIHIDAGTPGMRIAGIVRAAGASP